MDDKGCEVSADGHDILVCPGLPMRIISSQNWARQLKWWHGGKHKTCVTSYSDVTHISHQLESLKTDHGPSGWARNCPSGWARNSDSNACLPCWGQHLLSLLLCLFPLVQHECSESWWWSIWLPCSGSLMRKEATGMSSCCYIIYIPNSGIPP